jgi:hypothetical protein
MKNPFSFIYEQSSDMPRQAYRARVPGLKAKDLATQKVFQVHDISAFGIALEDEAGVLKIGDALEIDILLKDHSIIAGLKAVVTRCQNRVAGLKFLDPTQRQEERLDKLVLEVQKYLIFKSKIGESHGDDEHET